MNDLCESTRAGRVDLFDYLIVGGGYAGSVLAERLARGSGKQVLLVDRRPHIGGNAYDHYDDSGILVHKYGPHIFHTNSKEVFDYLSRFTDWRQYQHKVLASVDGQLVPIPINLDTINRLYGLNLNSFQMEEFLQSRAEPKTEIRTSEDVVVSKVGRELYEKFFRGYTRKQWGLDPSELDAQVTARVPTRTNRDDRYFTDTYQAMPKHGFTRMFEKMLDHPKTSIVYEYPQAEGDPYYPIPRRENAEIYRQYQALAEASGIHFVGRLATYKYYNMDQVVAQALTLYAKLSNLSRVEATNRVCEPVIATVTFNGNGNGHGKAKRARTASRRAPVL